MALAALIVAIVAALISLASAAYTRRQAIATEAAAAIEGKRLHDDLTPSSPSHAPNTEPAASRPK